MSDRALIPDLPEGVGSPFYYSSLSNLCLLFAVPVEHVTVPAGAFAAAGFSGTAVLGISFQRYLADFGSAALVVHELELSVVAVPKSVHQMSSTVTLDEVVTGQEQSLNIGFLPVAVACDAQAAITAGEKLFGEPKFHAEIDATTPAVNAGSTDGNWHIAYRRPDSATTDFSVEFRQGAHPGSPINASVVTTYGTRPDGPVGSRWSLFQDGLLHRADTGSTASITSTDPDAQVRSFTSALREGTFLAARDHRTRPVAVRGRPYSVF